VPSGSTVVRGWGFAALQDPPARDNHPPSAGSGLPPGPSTSRAGGSFWAARVRRTASPGPRERSRGPELVGRPSGSAAPLMLSNEGF
jgi:hypothetical protein